MLVSFCNGADDQRSLVHSRFIRARAEEGMNGVMKGIREGIHEHFGLHVVEGQQSLVIVHVDTDAGRSGVDRQAGRGFCSESVGGPFPQAEKPVAVGGAYGDFALPVDGVANHSQVPVGLCSHLHLKEGRVE